MRIKHNLPAEFSYRNLTFRNNKLNGNIEKLSSGYRINRAADEEHSANEHHLLQHVYFLSNLTLAPIGPHGHPEANPVALARHTVAGAANLGGHQKLRTICADLPAYPPTDRGPLRHSDLTCDFHSHLAF